MQLRRVLLFAITALIFSEITFCARDGEGDGKTLSDVHEINRRVCCESDPETCHGRLFYKKHGYYHKTR